MEKTQTRTATQAKTQAKTQTRPQAKPQSKTQHSSNNATKTQVKAQAQANGGTTPPPPPPANTNNNPPNPPKSVDTKTATAQQPDGLPQASAGSTPPPPPPTNTNSNPPNPPKDDPVKDEPSAELESNSPGGVIEQNNDSEHKDEEIDDMAFPELPIPKKGDPGESICDWLESLPDFFMNFGSWCATKLDKHVFMPMDRKAAIRDHQNKVLKAWETAQNQAKSNITNKDGKIDISKVDLFTVEKHKFGKDKIVKFGDYELTKEDMKNIVGYDGQPFDMKGKSVSEIMDAWAPMRQQRINDENAAKKQEQKGKDAKDNKGKDTKGKDGKDNKGNENKGKGKGKGKNNEPKTAVERQAEAISKARRKEARLAKKYNETYDPKVKEQWQQAKEELKMLKDAAKPKGPVQKPHKKKDNKKKDAPKRQRMSLADAGKKSHDNKKKHQEITKKGKSKKAVVDKKKEDIKDLGKGIDKIMSVGRTDAMNKANAKNNANNNANTAAINKALNDKQAGK